MVGAMEKNKDGVKGMENVAQRGRELPFSQDAHDNMTFEQISCMQESY